MPFRIRIQLFIKCRSRSGSTPKFFLTHVGKFEIFLASIHSSASLLSRRRHNVGFIIFNILDSCTEIFWKKVKFLTQDIFADPGSDSIPKSTI
jgi:hypothetical protein